MRRVEKRPGFRPAYDGRALLPIAFLTIAAAALWLAFGQHGPALPPELSTLEETLP